MPKFAKPHLIAGLAVAIALAAPLVAEQAMEKPGANDVTRVTAGSYTVDHYHTLVGWRVDHMGITPYFGTFGDITGTLVLDNDDPAKTSLDVTIPVAKVTTPSAGLTEHLLRAPGKPGSKPDFFGPNPADARFVLTRLVPDIDKHTARMTGNLTLNGVTKPVVLDASFYGAGKMPPEMGGVESIGFTAKGTIKRSDFGVTMGIPLVSDEVQLDIVAAFVKS